MYVLYSSCRAYVTHPSLRFRFAIFSSFDFGPSTVCNHFFRICSYLFGNQSLPSFWWPLMSWRMLPTFFSDRIEHIVPWWCWWRPKPTVLLAANNMSHSMAAKFLFHFTVLYIRPYSVSWMYANFDRSNSIYSIPSYRTIHRLSMTNKSWCTFKNTSYSAKKRQELERPLPPWI